MGECTQPSNCTNTNVELMRTCSPFVTTGDNWKMRRSELVPALTINRIRCFYPAMRDSALKAIEFLTAANARPQNAKELANRFAAQFMCHFIWSVEANAFCDPTKGNASPDWLCPLQRMADAFISQSFKCVRYFIRTDICPWLRKCCPVRFFPAITDRFFQQLLVDSLEARVQQAAQGNKVGRYGLRGDVVDHLQRLVDKKSIKDILQIAGHTTTVLIDGYETAAMLVAHCLLLLARNPRVQQKLRDELISADVANSFDTLNRLPYLDQCLHETLRLFPPLPSLFKLCTETITLQNSDKSFLTLHPGDAVYISTYSFHRDPDYFENPESFWPERFAEELGGVRKYREMGVFMPFGDGPRMCPGRKLGLAEVKVIVSELIKNFLVTCGRNTRSDNKLAADSFLLMLDGDIELVFERLQ
ncbi:probable cytochrome P450 28d2 [Anastrepha ludens]|uniref:probable cytochrome P450 28d2 n=1 Tax=Anastrepha ludens TaxID=28586 RepID=UPI0023AFA9AD|nr:probable cytochrome P450 28d2 [Anastrepha ludens]